jgi:hypothetical protein
VIALTAPGTVALATLKAVLAALHPVC